jgi:hypothetical protein
MFVPEEAEREQERLADIAAGLDVVAGEFFRDGFEPLTAEPICLAGRMAALEVGNPLRN